MTFSKTTLVGVLVLAITAMQAVKFDAAGHLAMTARDWFAMSLAVLVAVVGKLQKDAQ